MSAQSDDLISKLGCENVQLRQQNTELRAGALRISLTLAECLLLSLLHQAENNLHGVLDKVRLETKLDAVRATLETLPD